MTDSTKYFVDARKSGLLPEMLKAIIGELLACQEKYSKLLVIRMDLHIEDYTATNQDMTFFLKRFKRKLKQDFKLQNIGYAWVREQERSKKQHYHLVLFLNGHKVKHPANIINLAEWLWSGTIFTPKNCYYHTNRNQKSSLKGPIYRSSYLAKARGKGYKPTQTKNYSTSKLRFKR